MVEFGFTMDEKQKICSDSCLHKMCIRKYLMKKRSPLTPIFASQPKKSKVIDSTNCTILIPDDDGDVQIIDLNETTSPVKPECVRIVDENPKKSTVTESSNNENDKENKSGLRPAREENEDDLEIIELDEKYDDPGKWPNSLTELELEHIVDTGPKRISLTEYPKNEKGESFSEDLYMKKSKGDMVERRWLAYSESKDAVYCFCCKLLGDKAICDDPFSSAGFRQWKCAKSKLRNHEATKNHTKNFVDWLKLETLVNNKKPKIDQNIIEL